MHVSSARFYRTPIATFEWFILDIFHNSLAYWCIPIFVMVSGMFLLDYNRYSMDIRKNFKQIFKKNILKISIALIVWSIIYRYFHAYIYDEPMLFTYNFSFLFKHTYPHLWFLYLILGLYVLAPFLHILVRNLTKKDFEFLLIVFAICSCGYDFMSFITVAIVEHPLYLRKYIPEFSGFLIFFLAGYYFSKFEVSDKAKKKIYLLAIISCFFAVLNSFCVYKFNVGLKINNANKVLHTMFIAFGLFLFVKSKFSKPSVNTMFYNRISFLSSISFGIYLLHFIVLHLIVFRLGIDALTLNPIIMVPLLSVSVFIISAFLAFILSKIPILRKVV
ncbi:acyltransferase [Campylobacter sp. JMF_02 ED1]|uniref:acyltransferase n=1 Tax=Campylobacter sp. JMF_02 ED1 TaxID=2983826 RepID=UPI0022E9B230|nr:MULTISPECIES: acyltransferase [unclassified Campylobacter]MDA3049044.1 acyltransferase [Campylobacter sp. JMF_15 NE4]MDA3051531.1 acyltransferase [Campylobacter sp. JMF_02 ED1]